MNRRLPLIPTLGVFMLLLATLPACVTESKARKPPPPPPSIEPTTMLPAVQQPRDTDSNGYPDRIVVSIFLFNQQAYPQSSLEIDGTWRFTLQTPRHQRIAEWVISPQDAATSRARMGPGPCYIFNLDLLTHRTDVMDPVSANLGIEFTSTSGRTLRADPTALRLGRMTQ